MTPRTLTQLPGTYAVCRFDPDQEIPSWAFGAPGEFVSVTRSAHELSVICPAEAVPSGVVADPGWRCLRVEGPFGLDEPGVVASVVNPIAEAGLSVFAVATYETDHLLVTEVTAAVAALRAAGHTVTPAAAG